jgi:hypothetical protein
VWVRFTDDFSWRQPAFSIDYKAGMEQNVTRACADEALAAGKAVPAKGKRVTADGKKT